MKILVTGASGFIGRNIVEYFSSKVTCLAPLHSELELLDEDAVSKFFKNNPVDCLIHAAVRPGHRNAQDPSEQLKRNLRMFFNLVNNQKYFKKFIFLSSGLVYDQRYYQPKIKEEYFAEHLPEDEAGLSKYVIAKFMEKMPQALELRIFGCFGKYEDYQIRFISNCICKALFNLPLTIKQNRRFDYLFIDDLMPVLEHFIFKKNRHSAYNVASGQTNELLEIAQKILKISGKNLEIRISQDGLGTEYSADNRRLLEEVKRLKFTSLERAIEQLYLWYKENQQLIDRNALLTDK